MRPIALSIAGSDPSGGAGIQADLKTFHQHGVYGCAVVTLLTAQNTQGVRRVHVATPELIREQITALTTDMPPAVIKIGALGNASGVEAVCESLRDTRAPIVVDPVVGSKNGTRLLDDEGVNSLARGLVPMAGLIMPNLEEAELLTGIAVRDVRSMGEAARALVGMGAAAALVKGGHLHDDPVDVLYLDGDLVQFRAERVETPHTHGLGCTLSAAVAARVAGGDSLRQAVGSAKRWLTDALKSAPGYGGGRGGVNHHTPT